MKHNLLFIIALFVCASSFAQGEIDAYRYSNNDLSGTARGQAMGGAFGALGGDVTGVAINPAGLGIYRTSEIVANISLSSPMTSENSFNESAAKVSFDNLSYVRYCPLISGNLLSLNFGFNYNKIKDFNQTYSTSCTNRKNSLTDYMALLSDGIYTTSFDNNPYDNHSIPWLSVLAWDSYLIDPKKGVNNQYESILNENEQVSPSLRVSEKGRIESYDFSVSTNVSNNFFWGITVSITDISYVMKSVYDEKFSDVAGSGFDIYNYFETQGSGFQLKTGVIYKPVDELRIGVAYHSPTWYTMTDYYYAELTPRLIKDDNGDYAKITSTPKNAYSNYYLQTPGSLTLSLASVFSSKAIVSVDYELKNYTYMNLKDRDRNDYNHENKLIKEDYKNTSTLRAGMEYRFTPQLSGRLGYAWAQNPYKKSLTETGNVVETAGTIPHYVLSNCTSYYTGGLGFRFTPEFYVDFAMTLRTQNDDLYSFQPINVNNTESDSFLGTYTNNSLKGLLTFGYRF